MISKNDLKYYSSLLIKKYRMKEEKFLVEGLKIVEEGLNSNYDNEVVFVTPLFAESFPEIISAIRKRANTVLELRSNEFQRISDTKSPQGISAVFEKKYPKKNLTDLKDNILVLIDKVSDPGNLGTILRTCDWFGIYNVLLTNESAEYLNPKVIRSSMGSVFHLNIYDEVFENDITNLKSAGYQIISSDTKGKNIFNFNPETKSILVFSNESTGPSEMIVELADKTVSIPGKGRAESLNVSSAAAIIIANLVNKF